MVLSQLPLLHDLEQHVLGSCGDEDDEDERRLESAQGLQRSIQGFMPFCNPR